MLELLQNHAAIAWLGAGLLGLCVGSFLNVVIHRLPLMMEREWRAHCQEVLHVESASPADRETHSCDQVAATDTAVESAPDQTQAFNLLTPASRCPSCGHPVRPWQNIPVLSYLLLGGRCAECKTAISWRYPAIELVTALFAVAVVVQHSVGLSAAGGLLLTFALIALAVIDFDTQLLPDSITIPLLWLGLAFNLVSTYVALDQAVIGAMAGYLSLWSIYWLFKLVTGKEGMGYGDFKLMAALGAWLGWAALPGVILLSSIVGAVVGVTMIALRGHDSQVPIPFGPYIAAAGWLMFMWGEPISALYLGT